MSATSRPSDESGGRREDVLAAVRGAASAMTITAIADQLGVHPNTVRFHLDTLVADGRVERVEPDHRRPGRPPLLFRAVRRMDPGGSRRYQLLAEILTLSLASDRNASTKALEAGRAWGRRFIGPTRQAKAPGARQSIVRLVGLLAELGFRRNGVWPTARYKLDCGTALSLNWPRADPPWSARSTSGSCRGRWKRGVHQLRWTGWTRSSSRTCVWRT